HGPIGAVVLGHLVFLHDGFVHRIAAFAEVLFVGGPAHGILARDVVVLVLRAAGGVRVSAVVLLIDWPAGGVAALLHDGVVDRSVAYAGAVFQDSLVANAVTDSWQTALLGAAAHGGIAAGPAVAGGRWGCRSGQADQRGEQGERDLDPHL